MPPHAGDRFVISHIEPERDNESAIGLDIASEPRRREAALAAQASGLATITAPITLVQSRGKPLRSFLVLLPIAQGALAGNASGPGDALAGWSYTTVIIDEVLATLALPEHLAWIELRDAGSVRDAVFYTSAGKPPDGTLPMADAGLDVFGRHWAVRLRATPVLVEETRLLSPVKVGALGILVSGLAAAVAYLLAQRQARRRQLLRERAERAAIVDATDDGIVAVGMDGVIFAWSRGAQRLFGMDAVSAIGRPLREVLPQPAWLDEEAAILASAYAGRHVPHFETQRRHANGSLIDVSVGAAPILDPEGRAVALALSYHDIRAARAARRELERLNASLERQVEERTNDLDRALHDLRNIVDALPSMIGYWDNELRNRMANRAYADWFGLTPARLRGRALLELLGPELAARNRAHIDAALRGQAQNFQRSVPRPDRRGESHMMVHYLPDVVEGAVRGFYVLIHDVSELQSQRNALEAEKRDKAALLATIDAHAIVSSTDRRGNILAVNERFTRISGYSAAELQGKPHRIVNSGLHPPEFWQEMWSTVAAGATWHGEICNRARDGEVYWVDTVIAPFPDEHGDIERIIAFGTDVTVRKRTKEALRDAVATLESVLRSATQVAIIATEPGGVVTLFNRGAERLLGFEASDMVGAATPLDWHLPEELQARADLLAQRFGEVIGPSEVLEADVALDQPFDCYYRRKDGTAVPVTLSVASIQNPGTPILGYIHVAYDIRDRLRQQAALTRAVEEARLASEAKGIFLANMSHEIRTPLNAVIGLSRLLEDTEMNPVQAGYVAHIRAAGSALLAVLDNVLDLSKIEAGEMSLENVVFSLRDLCSDLQALFGIQAAAKGLELRLLPDAGLPDALCGDPTRLRQILVNLMGNALKFTTHGEVALELQCVASREGCCRLRFTVRDSGIGIDAAAQERLFAPFAQADASTTRRFGGTGLGLSIVRHLVKMMDGSIGLQSEPGRGSSFMVELPFRLVDPASLVPRLKAVTHGPRLQGVRILLVDDSEINLTVSGKLIEREGAQVITANNGAEAVEIAAAAAFDVILMDIQMPVMDGVEAASRIQASSLDAPPIIAFTAGNTDTERRRAHCAGFREVLAKPVDPEMLVQCLRRVLAQAAASRAPQGTRMASEESPGWPVVAGIDNDEANRRFGGDVELFERMLSRLLADCAAAGLEPAPETPEQSALMAARMHRLKGNAVTLAAHDIAAAAEEVDAACHASEPGKAGAALQSLARAAAALRDASSTLLQAPASPDGSELASLDPDALDALLRSLEEQALDAIEQFRRLSPALEPVLGSERLARIAAAVGELRFGDALALLSQGLRR